MKSNAFPSVSYQSFIIVIHSIQSATKDKGQPLSLQVPLLSINISPPTPFGIS